MMRRVRVAARVVEEKDGVFKRLLIGEHVYVLEGKADPELLNVANGESEKEEK